VWQGSVPSPLSAWAVQLLKGVNKVPFGTTYTQTYNGMPVIARVDYHTWHILPDGTVLTDLCWKGITLYKPLPTGATLGESDVTNIETAQPNDTLAVYDNVPSSTDWTLVAVTGGAAIGSVVLFLLALRKAGRRR
jgi:hypothetical protein